MVDQQLIEYLREKTKGKLLMSPEQVAEEIGIPAKQQFKLRKEGRLPILFKHIGGWFTTRFMTSQTSC